MLHKHNFKYLALIVGFALMGSLSFFSTSNAQGDTWMIKEHIPTGRSDCASCELDGKIYVMGGVNSTTSFNALKIVEVFDPKTNTWTTSKELPLERAGAAACTANGKIYLIGGKTKNPYTTPGYRIARVDEFDPITQNWTEKSPMSVPRSYLAACAVDGKIYAIGGVTTDTGDSLVEVYDTMSDNWTAKRKMPEGRAVFASAVLNGKIYVIGGADMDPFQPLLLKTVWEYDPITDTWTRKKDMPTARASFITGVVNGRIYAIGGETDNPNQPPLRVTEEYDPITDTWTNRTPMSIGRCYFSSGVVDDKIYVIGGLCDINLTITRSVEEYTPPAGTSIANMNLSLPVDFQLEQNYPNPFNPTTTINYALAKDSHARLTVYNSLGQVVAMLVDGYQAKGSYSVKWEANHQPSGIYLYQLKAGDFSAARKMFLQK